MTAYTYRGTAIAKAARQLRQRLRKEAKRQAPPPPAGVRLAMPSRA